jgi:hypothetical protein
MTSTMEYIISLLVYIILLNLNIKWYSNHQSFSINWILNIITVLKWWHLILFGFIILKFNILMLPIITQIWTPPQICFIKTVYFYFLIKKSKYIYIYIPKIFSRHERISLRAAKDQNTRRIARLRYFDKMGWRKEANWGSNPNLIKIERINYI